MKFWKKILPMAMLTPILHICFNSYCYKITKIRKIIKMKEMGYQRRRWQVKLSFQFNFPWVWQASVTKGRVFWLNKRCRRLSPSPPDLGARLYAPLQFNTPASSHYLRDSWCIYLLHPIGSRWLKSKKTLQKKSKWWKRDWEARALIHRVKGKKACFRLVEEGREIVGV